jgi:D-lactate dehydrogenase (cytochrome)
MASIAASKPHKDSAVPGVIRELQTLFGGRVVTSLAVREQHGNTVTWVKTEPPDAVVFPRSTQEVSDIVKLCAAHQVPVIAFGTGTSLEGHINAPLGGICLDLGQMKQVVAVHAEDLDCVIEPGITRKELNEYLRDQGLFFPIDPGADASIGGMVATRASGTNAVRYGTMKDCVLALTVVLPNGDIVKTAQRAKKSSAGYDLTHLFIGAEGTLGIITEITLRLHGIPEAVSAAVCQFPSVKAACDAVIATIQTGIPVARIELLDEMQVRAVNLYSKLDLPDRPMLLLEFHGSEASVQEQAVMPGRDRMSIHDDVSDFGNHRRFRAHSPACTERSLAGTYGASSVRLFFRNLAFSHRMFPLSLVELKANFLFFFTFFEWGAWP